MTIVELKEFKKVADGKIFTVSNSDEWLRVPVDVAYSALEEAVRERPSLEFVPVRLVVGIYGHDCIISAIGSRNNYGISVGNCKV